MSDPNAPAGPPEPVEPTPPQPPPPPGDYAPPAPPAAAAPPPTPPPASMPPPPPTPPPPGYGTPATAGAAAAPAFSVGEAFGWGWKKFTENLGPILIAVAVYAAILFVVVIVWYVILTNLFISAPSIEINQQTGVITSTGGSGFFTVLIVQALASFAFFILFAFLQAAVIRGALIIADGEKKLEVGDMFNFDKFGTVLVAAVIVGALTAVGYLFCFVGAIVVSFFTAFYLFFVLDKSLGAWDSVKASFELVKSNAGSVLLLLLGVIAAYIIGSILCGIGLVVTAPVALLALTFGYRRLQNDPIAA